MKRFVWQTGFTGALLIFCLTNPVQAQQGWQSEWEKTVQAAKKEGKLTVLTSYDEFLEAFKKEYPEIKTVSVTGKGSALWPRIMAERRAGKYLADVMISGAFPPYPDMYKARVLDPIRPALILPEVTDQSKWYKSEHRFVDRAGCRRGWLACEIASLKSRIRKWLEGG